MPVQLSYPGVYVEEVPSGVRTITGVATSITAFVGRAARGTTKEPVTVTSFGDFERVFGGLWKDGTLGFAVRDFFLNGGALGVIVRLYKADGAKPPKAALSIGTGTAKLALQWTPRRARSTRRWGRRRRRCSTCTCATARPVSWRSTATSWWLRRTIRGL